MPSLFVIPETIRRSPRWQWGLFALLVVLAVVVRVVPSLQPQFWIDEVGTTAVSARSIERLIEITARDTHPPLYYLIVHGLQKISPWFGFAGERLAFLRLASILPGVALCLAAWIMARRWWGAWRGLGALALFAVAPGLVYYSIELRAYELCMFGLLAGTACLIEAIDERGKRPWAATVGWAFFMALAFYTHSLTTLYLAAQGMAVAWELSRCRSTRRRLLGHAAVGLALFALLVSPWLPVMAGQSRNLNRDLLRWLNWARWLDLYDAFFFALPYGSMVGLGPWGGRWQFASVIALAGTAALVLHHACQSWMRRRPLPCSGRLLFYCGVLTFVPLLTAFALSYARVVKLWHVPRFNLLAAPFYLFWMLGLLFNVRSARWRRAGFALFWGLSVVFTIFGVGRRSEYAHDARWILHLESDPMPMPEDTFYWIDESVFPWLSRSGRVKLAPWTDALKRPADETVWLVNHYWTIPGTVLPALESTIVLTELLDRSDAVRKVDSQWVSVWPRIWRARVDVLAEIARELNALLERYADQRRSIAGGQRILAIDMPIRINRRQFSPTEFTEDMKPVAWTVGPRQEIEWDAEAAPGRYRLEAHFWRPHGEFPSPAIDVRYRLPGEEQWRSQRVEGKGSVTIGGEIDVRRRGEKLTLSLEIPTWVPAERIPGSGDRRELGLMFSELTLTPMP